MPIIYLLRRSLRLIPLVLLLLPLPLFPLFIDA